jgi:hypothetical protein
MDPTRRGPGESQRANSARFSSATGRLALAVPCGPLAGWVGIRESLRRVVALGMPRTVRVAIGAACFVAFLGAVSAAIWIADAAAGGSATRWVSSALGIRESSLRVVSPLYLAAIAIVPIAVRRDAPKARVASQLCLLAAITLAVTFFGMSGSPVSFREVDATLAAALLVVALVSLVAWSLSRPSAMAWFASGERRG